MPGAQHRAGYRVDELFEQNVSPIRIPCRKVNTAVLTAFLGRTACNLGLGLVSGNLDFGGRGPLLFPD